MRMISNQMTFCHHFLQDCFIPFYLMTDTQQAPDKVLARIRKRLEPGAIILLHDRMPDSDQLVKQILDLLKEQGYTVVRPDKLLA